MTSSSHLQIITINYWSTYNPLIEGSLKATKQQFKGYNRALKGEKTKKPAEIDTKDNEEKNIRVILHLGGHIHNISGNALGNKGIEIEIVYIYN